MQWNLEQLRAFIAAAERGSFSGAARAMGKAQSAVSTQISLLEADLGVELFERGGRLPTLTAAGATLLGEAREVLRQCGQLEARALALGVGGYAELRIAVDEGLQYSVLLRMFKALADKFPHLKVSLAMGSTNEVHAWVKNRAVELGVAFEARAQESREIDAFWLGHVEQLLVAAQDHPLARKERVERRDLARYRQILVGFATEDDMHETALSPLNWTTNSSYMAADLAKEELGWTMLPVSLTEYGGLPEGLKVLKPEGVALPRLNIQMLRRADVMPGELGEWLKEYLQKELEK